MSRETIETVEDDMTAVPSGTGAAPVLSLVPSAEERMLRETVFAIASRSEEHTSELQARP